MLTGERRYLSAVALVVAVVDLNHRPLSYEDNNVNDDITFQRLDVAGTDKESREKYEDLDIGLPLDHVLWLSILAPCRAKRQPVIGLKA